MTELPPSLHESIQKLSEKGDLLAERGRHQEAIAEYRRAWDLVPEPKTDWEAATWILAAIGDAAYHAGDLHEARDALQSAMRCPDGLGNPFLHLRLGQALFDLGEADRAADELMRAYMGAGEDIFADEDGRYLAFLGTRAKLD